MLCSYKLAIDNNITFSCLFQSFFFDKMAKKFQFLKTQNPFPPVMPFAPHAFLKQTPQQFLWKFFTWSRNRLARKITSVSLSAAASPRNSSSLTFGDISTSPLHLPPALGIFPSPGITSDSLRTHSNNELNADFRVGLSNALPSNILGMVDLSILDSPVSTDWKIVHVGHIVHRSAAEVRPSLKLVRTCSPPSSL